MADVVMVKGGLNRNAAIAAGMKLAQTAAKKLYRYTKGADAQADVLSAAYEAVVLAWQSWQPEKGPWEAHAYVYAAEYAKRESNKSKSVVTGSYADAKARTIQRDVVDPKVVMSGAVPSFERECEEAEAMRDLYERVQGAMRAMPSSQQRVAYALVESGLLRGDDLPVKDIAATYGVSRQTIYNVRDKMLAAAQDQ